MAQPGPAKKPAARRQRRNKLAAAKPPALTVVAGGKSTRAAAAAGPKADTGWLSSTKKRWTEFWVSPVAQRIAPALDLAALERLFSLYDERQRAYTAFRRNRLVKGSQGQPVLNPLGRQIASCDAEIRQLEDRLGMSPIARLKLGIELDPAGGAGGPPASLDELNGALSLDDDAFDD